MSDLNTLHNTAGDYQILYEIEYAFNLQHRRGVGYGDTEHSHYTRERALWHCVAINEALAVLAWNIRHPARVGYELVSCRPICTINSIITGVNS